MKAGSDGSMIYFKDNIKILMAQRIVINISSTKNLLSCNKIFRITQCSDSITLTDSERRISKQNIPLISREWD